MQNGGVLDDGHVQKSCDHAPENAELTGNRRKPRAEQHGKQRTRRGERHGDKQRLGKARACHHRKNVFRVLAERSKARHAQHAADQRSVEPHAERIQCQQVHKPDVLDIKPEIRVSSVGAAPSIRIKSATDLPEWRSSGV